MCCSTKDEQIMSLCKEWLQLCVKLAEARRNPRGLKTKYEEAARLTNRGACIEARLKELGVPKLRED